ncbi:MAG: hypothetical protein NTV97_01070 [Alphaproteobacteria bacterium]|nr:hypothetical protein [Alphaproteobacteria bacterium]
MEMFDGCVGLRLMAISAGLVFAHASGALAADPAPLQVAIGNTQKQCHTRIATERFEFDRNKILAECQKTIAGMLQQGRAIQDWVVTVLEVKQDKHLTTGQKSARILMESVVSGFKLHAYAPDDPNFHRQWFIEERDRLFDLIEATRPRVGQVLRVSGQYAPEDVPSMSGNYYWWNSDNIELKIWKISIDGQGSANPQPPGSAAAPPASTPQTSAPPTPVPPAVPSNQPATGTWSFQPILTQDSDLPNCVGTIVVKLTLDASGLTGTTSTGNTFKAAINDDGSFRTSYVTRQGSLTLTVEGNVKQSPRTIFFARTNVRCRWTAQF